MNNRAEGVNLFTHQTCMNTRACVLDGIKIQKCWCWREKRAKIPLEAREITDDKLALLHDMRFLKQALARSRLPSRIASIAVHVIHWRVCSQANGGIVARSQLRETIKIKGTHLIVKCYFRCGWHHGWAACAGRHGSHHKTHRILGAFDYLHSLVMGCVTEIVTINLRKNEK